MIGLIRKVFLATAIHLIIWLGILFYLQPDPKLGYFVPTMMYAVINFTLGITCIFFRVSPVRLLWIFAATGNILFLYYGFQAIINLAEIILDIWILVPFMGILLLLYMSLKTFRFVLQNREDQSRT